MKNGRIHMEFFHNNVFIYSCGFISFIYVIRQSFLERNANKAKAVNTTEKLCYVNKCLHSIFITTGGLRASFFFPASTSSYHRLTKQAAIEQYDTLPEGLVGV